MDAKTQIRAETVGRLVKQIDARPAVAWKRDGEAEQLAQRLRRIPTANLRRRIVVA